MKAESIQVFCSCKIILFLLRPVMITTIYFYYQVTTVCKEVSDIVCNWMLPAKNHTEFLFS